jgi:hypothetical protein
MKRRRGDGGNTANNASLQGLKSDTGSGEGKDRWLCVEITHIYVTAGKKPFSASHFGKKLPNKVAKSDTWLAINNIFHALYELLVEY